MIISLTGAWYTDLNTFGENVLRERRKQRGLTQQQMAERIGVDQSRVTRIERGLGVPKDLPTAQAYAKAYRLNKAQADRWYQLLYGLTADQITLSPHNLGAYSQAFEDINVTRMEGNPQYAIRKAEVLIDYMSQQIGSLAPSLEALPLFRLYARILFEKAAFYGECARRHDVIPHTKQVVKDILRLAKRCHDDHQIVGLVYHASGLACYVAGRYGPSASCLSKAVELIPEPVHQCWILRTLALDYARLGDGANYLKTEQRILNLIEQGQVGQQHMVCFAYEGLGRSRGVLGWSQALEYLRKGQAVYQHMKAANERAHIRMIQLGRSEIEVIQRRQPEDVALLDDQARALIFLATEDGYPRHATEIQALWSKATTQQAA